jgi:acyl-CoA thioester hydrolase
MAKPERWRLDAASYPLSITANTRFQDLDVNGHLNNVAFASLFENARVQINRNVRPWEDRPENERTMVAAVTINYLREGNFPDDVRLCSGIGHIGTSSWSIIQAMFQNSLCIATCDTVVVCRTDNQAKPLRAELREGLEKLVVKPPELEGMA